MDPTLMMIYNLSPKLAVMEYFAYDIFIYSLIACPCNKEKSLPDRTAASDVDEEVCREDPASVIALRRRAGFLQTHRLARHAELGCLQIQQLPHRDLGH